MGFEGQFQKRPNASIDQILADLKKGEIVAGDKGFKSINTQTELGQPIILQYNRNTGDLTFEHGGLIVEAVIRDNEVVSQDIYTASKRQPVEDKAQKAAQFQTIYYWIRTGVFE